MRWFFYRDVRKHQKSQEGTQKDVYQNFSSFFSVFKLPLCELVVFIEFQNILERKLSNCFGQLLLIKKMLNMELKMILIVLMEFAYIRHF